MSVKYVAFIIIRAFTEEKGYISLENVGHPLAKSTTSVPIGKSILEKFMSAVVVGNVLLTVQVFIVIREFTLEKGIMYAVNAGYLLLVNAVSLFIKEGTLRKNLMNVPNMAGYDFEGV